MPFIRHATFEVLAVGYADAQGSVPAAVSRVGGTGSAFFKSAHRHEFDYEPRPGYLYVRSRAISSRTNDNFDTFPAHAIEAAWQTFIGKPVFVNHHNSNHRRNRGVIIDAALHKDAAPDGSADTWVEVLMEVDAIRFPKLAEAVVKGWIDRTSMGTEVALSTCSFCGNQAANPTEYCRHIPAMKGQRIIRTQGTQREAVLISEICEGLFFFENSLLVEAPADPTAFTFGLDTRGLAAEKTTAHLARTATLDVRTAGLLAVEAEANMVEGRVENESNLAGRANVGTQKELFSIAESLSDAGLKSIAMTVNAFARTLAYRPAADAHSEKFTQGAFPAARDAALADLLAALSNRPDGVSLKVRSLLNRVEALAHPHYTAALAELTDFDIIEAEAILSKQASMCSECNPDLKGSTNQLCAPHVGRSSLDVLSSVNGTGACRGYQCSCPAYDFSRNIGVYPTCSCGHTQNVHTDENGDDVATAPSQKAKRGSIAKDDEAFAKYDARMQRALRGDKTASSSTGETYTFQDPDGKWWWEYHDEYLDGPIDSGGPFPTSEAAFQASCQQYSPSAIHVFPIGAKSLFGDDLFAYRTPPWEKRASKTALGEQRAPAQVDTMRLDSCPVCGDDTGFDGTRCRVCQFIKPPAMFDDPNVEKAKQVDLRGGDVGEVGQESEQLQCDNCGQTFPVDNEAKAVDTTQPGAGVINADPPADKAPSKSPIPPKKKAPSPKTSAFAPGEVEQGVQPETGFGEQPNAPAADGTLHDGSTCPSCGVGVLHAAPANADPADALTPDAGPDVVDPDGPVDPGVVDPDAPVDPNAPVDPDQQDPDPQQDPQQEGLPGTKPGQQPPAQNPVHPDHGAPVVPDKTKPKDEADDADSKDKDDDGKDQSQPPWLKKKKAASHRAGSQSKETVDMTTNPAQEGRNRLLAALSEQQSQISAQALALANLRRAVTTIATAAGISAHPHFAALMSTTAADEENNPVATSRDEALKPDAKDDPNNVGAAPDSANTGVTPEATTDVNNTNVAIPGAPLNHLVDVTAPTSGTDVPKGDAAHVETDVKYTAPSTEPFPDNSGWKKSSREGEDPQVRLMASLRLAASRKSMGLADEGIEDVTAAQQINDDPNLTLALIQHEINTLSSVAAARKGVPFQPTTASRSLVPQRAEVPRVMPSLTAQSSAGIQTIGSSTAGVAESQVRDSLI